MIGIILADDHDLVRDTIAAYLSKEADFEVLTATSLDGAIAEAKGPTPVDLIILDYNMPGMKGLSGLKKAQAALPACKFAIMSGVASRQIGAEAIEQGALGFLPKSMTAKSLVNAVRFMASGEVYMPFNAAMPEADAVAHPVLQSLTAREKETLEQLCLGLSNKEIARKLDIQEVTVKLHVKAVLQKLSVTNRTQAALFAKEHLFF